MNTSEEIHELAAALAKAQGAMDAASKDSVNPHFKARYADLAAVRAAIQAPLSANGIAYVQTVRTRNGAVEIETRLIHASGQYIGDTLEIPLAQATAQAIGSACSYGRRYSLMAIVGLAAEDDDAEAAHGRGNGGVAQGRQIAPRVLPEGDAKRRADEAGKAAKAYVATAKTALLNAEFKEDVDEWWHGEAEAREANGVVPGSAEHTELKSLAAETKRSLQYRDLRAAG